MDKGDEVAYHRLRKKGWTILPPMEWLARSPGSPEAALASAIRERALSDVLIQNVGQVRTRRGEELDGGRIRRQMREVRFY